MTYTVTTIVQDFREPIAQWMQQIAEDLEATNTYDEELIRRANFIVRNKALQIDYFHSATQRLYITIQDTQASQVEIDFIHSTVSCTCLQQPWCRHSVAGVMALYQYHHSLQQWTTAWRAQKNIQLTLMANERTPASWYALAKAIVDQTLPRDGQTLQPYLISAIDEDIHAKIRKHTPLEREWQTLFRFYTELYVLDALWAHIGNPAALQGPIFSYFLTRKAEKLKSIIDDLAKRSKLFEMDAFYAAIEQLLRVFTLEREGYALERFSFYRYYWEVVARDKTARQQELQKLEAISLFPTTEPKLLFAVLLQDEQQLLHATASLTEQQVGLYIELAQAAQRQQLTAIAAQLARATLPLLTAYIHKQLQPAFRTTFIQAVAELFQTINITDDEERQLYESFGPHGLQHYSNYLLRNERYRQWSALHLLFPTSIAYLEACGLKDVLATQPAVTLPLYHVYALKEVEQKSRLNYKQAVRIWKMMKSAAKKSNKAEYFNAYIDGMQQQYKRLRALQEEIEKGKLQL